MAGGGSSGLLPYAAIVDRYAGPAWNPPEAFTWNALKYEALGPDAVVVTGSFTWDPKGARPAVTIAYTALLRREEGVLRIRLEDE